MERIAVNAGTWVLVCDGAKALLFENAGDALAINLKLEKEYVEEHPPTRKIGTERPGRAYDSMGSSRSAVRAVDYHAQAEVQFLRRIAGELDQLAGSGRVRRLIVVAPPRALGIWRDSASRALREVVAGELGRDLVKHPVAAIEQELANLRELPEA